MKDPEYVFIVFNEPWACCLRYDQSFVLGSQLLKARSQVLSRLNNGVFAYEILGGAFFQISIASHGKGDLVGSVGHCDPSHIHPLSDAELCGVSLTCST